nr:ribonuclease H-like domain containing protein [Tanacetum cinerariifolium]
VSTLENELSSTKSVYHKAFITLTKRVKKLETQLKHKRSRAIIHSSDEEEPSVDIKDYPKQGRMIEELDKDEDVNLTFATTKDKRKRIMQETEFPKKIKKREMIQLSLDEESAQKLYAKELAKEVARQEKEKYNLEKALELQRQLDKRENDIDKGDQAQKINWNDPKEGYKQSYFKGMKYEDIRPIFERGYDVTVWKLVSSSGVHIVRFKNLHIFMLVDKAYPLTAATITKMLERKLSADSTTPFSVVYGPDPPSLLPYVMGETKNTELEQQLIDRDDMLKLLRFNLTKVHNCMRNQVNSKRREVTFQVGDYAFLKIQLYRQKSLAKRRYEKLSPRFFGPYRVKCAIGSVAYKLELPDDAKIHPVFHVFMLKPVHGSFSPNSDSVPPLR